MLGRYFDGESSKSYNVTIEIIEDGILLNDSEGNFQKLWNFANIKKLPNYQENSEIVLTIEDSNKERLIINREIYNNFAKLLPRKFINIQIAASYKIIYLLTILVIVISILIYKSIPLISKSLVDHIPDNLYDNISKYALDNFNQSYQICQNQEASAAFSKITKPLLSSSGLDGKINIIIAKGDISNAMALPGGNIIIFYKIISAAKSEDEIAGVIAHELAHVKLKHPEEFIIRENIGSALIFITFGSNIFGDITSVANYFREKKYSRDAESDADNMAANFLKKSGYNPHGLSSFFTRLQQENKNDKINHDGFTYLSTHPALKDRIKAISNFDDFKSQKYLNDEEWLALQNICFDQSKQTIEEEVKESEIKNL